MNRIDRGMAWFVGRFGFAPFPILMVLIFLATALAGCQSATRVDPAETTIIRIRTPKPAADQPPPPGPSGAAGAAGAFLDAGGTGGEVRAAGPYRPLLALAAVLAVQDGSGVRIQVDGREIAAPAGSEIEIVHSKGSRVTSSSEDVLANVKTSAPEASLDGVASGSAGGLRYVAKLTGKSESSAILFVLGGLMIVAAAVVGWLGRLRLAVALAAGGLALIAVGVVVETYPWAMLVGLLALVGVGVFLVLDSRAAKVAPEVLQTVAAGIKRNLPADLYAQVKAAVHQEAAAQGVADQVKAAVNAAKRKAGV